MPKTYTMAERAEGKIGIGIDRLAELFPFHASVLSQKSV